LPIFYLQRGAWGVHECRIKNIFLRKFFIFFSKVQFLTNILIFFINILFHFFIFFSSTFLTTNLNKKFVFFGQNFIFLISLNFHQWFSLFLLFFYLSIIFIFLFVFGFRSYPIFETFIYFIFNFATLCFFEVLFEILCKISNYLVFDFLNTSDQLNISRNFEFTC